MSARDGEIRLGLLRATQSQLTQIEAWAAHFRKTNARVDLVAEVGHDRFDVILAVVEPNSEPDTALRSLVARAGIIPCIILASQDPQDSQVGEALMDAALVAGAADYLPLPSLDAARLERAVRFSMRKWQELAQVKTRERCLAAAQERERQKLANALHDGPLQDLIGARFLLGALGPGVQTEDVQDSLQQVSQAVRALCSELKPPALGPFGLEKAIRAHMQGLLTRTPEIAVTLELDVDHQQLPEWARLALFRVFQAAVQNVVQHAQATQIWVRLQLDTAELRLTIADDGQGFDLPTNWLDFAHTQRFGLLMMQERVDALQGRIMVQSSPGSGTRVWVQAPLVQPQLPLPAYFPYAASERNGKTT